MSWRLTGAGAHVVWPFKGLSQGQHLAWYRTSTPPEVDGTLPSVLEAVALLGASALARDVDTFPWVDVDLASPGLYAWYVDLEGSPTSRPVSGTGSNPASCTRVRRVPSNQARRRRTVRRFALGSAVST